MRTQRTLAIALATPLFALLAASPAAAIPPSTVQVDDSSSDAPLSSEGKTNATCESTDTTKGCTLRAAVELADQLSIASGETIAVEVPPGTYTNTPANGRELAIRAEARVRIAGAGARKTVIDGGGEGSVFFVEEPAILTLEGVTVRHGSEEFGGGIYAEPETAVQLVNTTIAENEAFVGGGVFIAPEGQVLAGLSTRANPSKTQPTRPSLQLPAGPGLEVVGSTISHNFAEGAGAGAYIEDETFNEIVNSTIAENEAGEVGGGIAVHFAGVALSMDTLVDNSAHEQAGSGNIAEGPPAGVVLHQALIAEPSASGGPGCDDFGGPPLETFGYNLDYPSTPPGAGEVDACGLSEERHDLVGLEPHLEPSGLADNGGETDTIAPDGGFSATPSPAVDAVPLAECGAAYGENEFEPVGEDQRGSPRPDPNGPATEPDCDIGAYEFSATIVTPTCSAPAPVNAGERVTVACTIEKSEGLFATGTTASFTLPAGATLDSAAPSQGNCVGTGCQLGTIDPATVTIVLTPSVSGTLAFTASDNEHGAKSTSVPVTVKAATPLPTPVASKPHQCKSRRDFKIHIQHVRRLKIVSAVVYVNKRRERALRGRALHAAINLRGLPKGTFTVKIVARTASGKRLVGARIYHTCVGRRPPHKHLFL
jgi:hypothetical protein